MNPTNAKLMLLLPACAALSMINAAGLAQPCVPIESEILVADDGGVGDAYGWAVAIDGEIAVVGAVNDDARGADSGSVYILRHDGSGWDETHKIVPVSIRSNDSFGDAVGISGNTIVVGAPGDDDSGSGAGAAYVFEFVNNAWTQTALLVPPAPAAGDNFASSVDIDGDTIVVGAMLDDDNGGNAGKAYIYRRVAGSWGLEASFQSDDIAEFDRFGKDVAISGDRALISCDSDDDLGPTSGSAYVFTRVDGVWTQTAKLLASDGDADDQFGERLDIDQDTIIVGARYDDAMGTWSGSAYIFEYDGASWNEQVKLNAYDAGNSEFFGHDVAIHQGRAMVGAWGQNDPFGLFNAGAAYAYSRTSEGWGLDRKIVASDQEGWDFFGYSVAISSEHAIIGADGNDDFWWGQDAGAVYMITLNCEASCSADLNSDGSLDFFDISYFLNNRVDYNNDSSFNFFDVSAFLAAFAAGCP